MGAPISATASAALGGWSLVGRIDELRLARAAIDARSSVVIAGDAGDGKSRLAREIIEGAKADGWAGEWAVATHSGASIPLGALAHLLSTDSLDGGRDATLRAMTRALEGHGGKFVLGVDDAHLLDEVSAVLVHQLVSTGVASAVVTVRRGASVADPILALWKDSLAVRFELQPLSRAEVGELLTAVLGGPIDGAAVHMLGELSRGNALFLRELVLGGLESGALRVDQGLWHWDGPLVPGQRLRDLVASRLGPLGEAERDALEVLAVGEPVPLEYLATLVQPEVITHLERRGLIRSHHEPGAVVVRLAHPVFGEVVEAEVPPLRLDGVRRRLADTFQSHSDLSGDHLLRVATWRADAGDRSDPRVLVLGARRAWGMGEADLAERLARAALDAAPDFEAGYLLGEALADRGHFEEAVAVWRSVEHLPATDEQRAAFAAGLAGILLWGLGRPADAHEAVRRAAAQVADPAARADLSTFGSLAGVLSAETSSQATEIARVALEGVGPWERSHVRAALAAVLAWTEAGRLDHAVAVAHDAIAAADRHPEELPATALLLRLVQARALGLAGRLHEADSVAESGYARALEHHDDSSRARCCMMRGAIAVLRGRPRFAVARLQEGERVLRAHDDGFLRWLLANLSMAAALLGDLELAGRALRDAEEASATLGRLFDGDVVRARAWVCFAGGERSAGERHARDAAARARSGEQRPFEALVLHDLARFGRPETAAPRLKELTGVVEGKLVPLFAAHADGLVRADGVALDAAAAGFADLGFDLYAAEAAAAASTLHRHVGRKASALASANRSRAWAERCEDARTFALASLDQPDELTVREREVATLAARGRSDREIAETLFISVRTVHAHLRSAYTKLGVSGRGALAAPLGIRTDGEHP